MKGTTPNGTARLIIHRRTHECVIRGTSETDDKISGVFDDCYQYSAKAINKIQIKGESEGRQCRDAPGDSAANKRRRERNMRRTRAATPAPSHSSAAAAPVALGAGSGPSNRYLPLTTTARRVVGILTERNMK